MLEKTVKLSASPFQPYKEAVDDILMELSQPYSKKKVTILINPNIQVYKEKADIPVIKERQASASVVTDETIRLLFDFKVNTVHRVTIQNRNYEIRLMTIDTENIKGQEFLYFEFFVKGI
jgi:hypothetical protein